MDATDLSRRLDWSVQAARLAGQLTLKYFQQPDLAVERKSDESPVTLADREAEQLLRRQTQEAFPEDGILGEEFGETPGRSGLRWIFDPIDGTKSFISGVPLYGTMVALEQEGQSVLGVVYICGLDECVYAAKGLGAWHVRGNSPPKPARVSSVKTLHEGLFVTSQVDSFAERGAADVFDQLKRAAYITRTWGDCYGYLLVATGRAAVMVDPVMNVWDAAAVAPIVEEAGGVFVDWQGAPSIHSGESIAANPHILAEVLEITRRFAKQAL